MCGGRPCFNSVCGISLQKSVIIVGVLELVLTVIVTILNIVKYAKSIGALDDDYSECDDKDVCIGPIIKYAVFDAFFGVGCSLLLIFGAHLRNNCLLISWVVITIICSLKYVYVVTVNDWSRLEDWISILYLVFYISVTLIIISLIHEVKHTRSGGYVHTQAPAPITHTHTTVVVNQPQIPLQPQYPQQGYYPAPQQPPPSYAPQQQAPYNPGY